MPVCQKIQCRKTGPLKAPSSYSLSLPWTTACSPTGLSLLAFPAAVNDSAALREANSFDIGSMINSQTDPLRLRALGLKGKPRKAPVIHSIQWQPPPPGWMKVNTDGCSRGQPGPSSCGGIFRNCRGFVHGCFELSLGQRIRISGRVGWGRLSL